MTTTNTPDTNTNSETETKTRRPRRRISNAFKLALVQEAERLKEAGEPRAPLLRMHGLFDTQFNAWSKAAAAGTLVAEGPLPDVSQPVEGFQARAAAPKKAPVQKDTQDNVLGGGSPAWVQGLVTENMELRKKLADTAPVLEQALAIVRSVQS